MKYYFAFLLTVVAGFQGYQVYREITDPPVKQYFAEVDRRESKASSEKISKMIAEQEAIQRIEKSSSLVPR